MFKIVLFFFLIILLLAIDGTLTYDIFAFKMDTVFEWLMFLTILGIAGSIYWADHSKGKK